MFLLPEVGKSNFIFILLKKFCIDNPIIHNPVIGFLSYFEVLIHLVYSL